MIVHEAAGLRCDTAILDGEMIVQNQDGVSDFGALRSAITAAPERLILYAFDLLMLNGKDLRGLALTDRRKRLQDLVGHHPESRIHFSEDLVGNGPEVFRAAERLGLEGIVSKRPEGRYMSGDRSRLWLKTKTFATSRLRDHRRREHLDRHPDRAAGRRRQVCRQRHDHAVAARTGRPSGSASTPSARRSSRLLALHKRKGAQWVKPGLVATVRHLRGEEKLRHATILGVRDRRVKLRRRRRPKYRQPSPAGVYSYRASCETG